MFSLSKKVEFELIPEQYLLLYATYLLDRLGSFLLFYKNITYPPKILNFLEKPIHYVLSDYNFLYFPAKSFLKLKIICEITILFLNFLLKYDDISRLADKPLTINSQIHGLLLLTSKLNLENSYFHL